MKNKMPTLFVGHGSPMNAIEDNEFTKNWQALADKMPRPEAIVCVSAHWYTDGSRIMDEAAPKMIYDMYGFPEELYQVTYPAKGAPELARMTKDMISREVKTDQSWGYDHGNWSVLSRIYPNADIPLFQLSVDANADTQTHFEIGRQISALRDRGVMILGSGNVVHNLGRIDWNMENGGYDWAEEFDAYIKDSISDGKYSDVIEYRKAGDCAQYAFVTPDHFDPLLYVLGASREDDTLSIFNDSCVMGSMSMTCYLFE